MTPNQPIDIEQQIANKVTQIREQDSAGKRAAATALPGPLANAFAPCLDLPVGPYTVRPFYDIDFEFLSVLKHPLDEQFKDVMEGKESPNRFLPRGLPAWQMFWIMTRPVDETEMMLAEQDGIAKLNALAKAEFSRLQTRQLGALFEAVMKQVALSNSTAIEYGNAPAEGEKVKENPPLPLRQATG